MTPLEQAAKEFEEAALARNAAHQAWRDAEVAERRARVAAGEADARFENAKGRLFVVAAPAAAQGAPALGCGFKFSKDVNGNHRQCALKPGHEGGHRTSDRSEYAAAEPPAGGVVGELRVDLGLGCVDRPRAPEPPPPKLDPRSVRIGDALDRGVLPLLRRRTTIQTLGDLTAWGEASLRDIPGFGETRLAEVKAALQQRGLDLAADPYACPVGGHRGLRGVGGGA